MDTGDTLVIIPEDDLMYIGKEIENMEYERAEDTVLKYNGKTFNKTGDGNQYIRNIEFGTNVEGKCIFEDFEGKDQIISLGYLPDKDRRADILADIIDINDIKINKE